MSDIQSYPYTGYRKNNFFAGARTDLLNSNRAQDKHRPVNRPTKRSGVGPNTRRIPIVG